MSKTQGKKVLRHLGSPVLAAHPVNGGGSRNDGYGHGAVTRCVFFESSLDEERTMERAIGLRAGRAQYVAVYSCGNSDRTSKDQDMIDRLAASPSNTVQGQSRGKRRSRSTQLRLPHRRHWTDSEKTMRIANVENNTLNWVSTSSAGALDMTR